MKKNILLTITILFLVFGIFGNAKITKASCCIEKKEVSVSSVLGMVSSLDSGTVQLACAEPNVDKCPSNMKFFNQPLSCTQLKEVGGDLGSVKFICTSIASATTSAPITKVTAVAPAKYEYSLLEGIPGFAEAGEVVEFPTYIMYIYNFGIWTIGICAMFMIALGGYMYLTSAGNTAGTGKAKGIITDAIVGLVLALASFLILYTINPDLVKFNSLTSQPTINSNSQCPPLP